MKTVTLAWLSGVTYLRERADWSPGDRQPQFTGAPGYRCACGEIIVPGDKVEVIHGTRAGRATFWAQCPNCGNTAF